MNNFRLLKIGFAFLFLVSSWAQADNGFSRVYVFGDSLSDTGNLASITGPFPMPPYFMNRVSNGPVAVEVLASRLGLDAAASLHLLSLNNGSNYSVATASARVSADPIDLDTQIFAFLANHGNDAPADALYVVFIGGNDIRDARGEADLTEARNIVKEAADKVKNAIETLAVAGAESFLLVNAPDVGSIPETQLTGDPELIKRTSRLSKLYRKRLHRIANQLDDDDDDGNEIEIVEFDLFKFLRKLLRKADKLGFTNTTDPCFSTSLYLPTSFFHPDCNFDQFVFFDEIHPTARAHALAGEAMFEALKEDGDDDDDDDDSDNDSD